ncbi:Serine/threonine protein kinase [Candidatus Sulfopaludibacter sp. SbA4]|nr:Serine/threonine protein kinase [Candidatus Sulfopaludibacter sp. SbA4]
MSLSPGDKLGPYEILAPIGAGGMGEVYRARDPRLNRDVAIKVSQERFSDRFEREARAVAALNHPNICTLYDVGPDYLVMEFIEGESPKGPLPLEEALRIARQIADALEAAHEKGVVHRDLKPANIKIKPDGTVKVLDFGLAQVAQASRPVPEDPQSSPTLTISPTRMGMILGTAAYMSPEQARGKTVDKRADIWAFGVVLYELLTGERLFTGEDATEILAAVIHKQPDLAKVPRPVRRLLEECLQKDPRQRLRDIGDAWKLLEEVTTGGAGHRFLWPAFLAAMLLAAIALWAPWRAAKPVDRPLVRLDVDLGADVSLPPAPFGGSSIAISPDGTRLAYASGNPVRLFVRRLDQLKATELPGTQGATRPFFSPDGQWVGFDAGNKISKISVEGGAVVRLGDIGSFAGASWGEDGGIVVSQAGKGLVRFPAGGGPTEPVAELGNGELVLAVPQILPGGRAILFVPATGFDVDKDTIEVLTLADRHRKIVARGAASPRYLPTSNRAGHLVYVNKATLFAVPFDPEKLETRGTAVPVLDDVAYDASTGTGQFDFSPAPSGHGTLVYRRASGGTAGMMTVQWVDPTGRKEPLLPKPGVYEYLSLSPDGKRVALTVIEGGSRDIWVYDPQRDAMTRLTFGGALYYFATWSPDGRYVVFSSPGNGIFQARPDGAGQPQALTQGKQQYPASFTPDGKRLAYVDFGAGNSQIWTVPLEDRSPLASEGGQLKAGKPEQFLKSGFSDIPQGFSPDGRWLAYTSNESGKSEVYVRAFPPPPSGQGGKWQISNSGGTGANWSRNGHDLMYHSGDQIMAASYTVKGDTFVPEKPRVWIARLRRDRVGSGSGWPARGRADARGDRESAHAGTRSGLP